MTTGVKTICATIWRAYRQQAFPNGHSALKEKRPISFGKRSCATSSSDKVWKGKHKNGTEFIQYFDKAGNTAYRSSNTNITGVVEVHGSNICETFAGYFRGRTVCGYVYRNTTHECNVTQAYIHVTPQALTYFSLVP